MSKRAKTKSFVAEFPLKVHRAQHYVLTNRFLASGDLYNGVLGEIKAREHRMRMDPAWQAARQLPRGKPKSAKSAARNKAFNAVKDKHGFTEHSLEEYATDMMKRSWISHHMGSHDTQAISKRAFQATNLWVYDVMGEPSFKPRAEQDSIEGKTNDAIIRFKDGAIHWSGLVLPLVLTGKNDQYGWQADALACRTKYCRVLKTGDKYAVQLVQEGLPPTRDRVLAKDGKGCYDLGTKTLGVFVPGKAAALIPLNNIADFHEREIARIQRAMDRSQRAMNPGNYKADGTIRKGRKTWVKSQNYKVLEAELKKIKRKEKAERKRARGELTNQLRAVAKHWKRENTSGKAMQKNFGKSIEHYAPAAFAADLERKCDETGGSVYSFSTFLTKLSQYDHTTDDYLKKPLSMRMHHFRDGITLPVQRDMYSALLGCFVRRVNDQDLLDTCQVKLAWLGAEPLLRLPVKSLEQLIPKRQKRPQGTGFPSAGPVGGRHEHEEAPAGVAGRQRKSARKSTSTVRPALRDMTRMKTRGALRKSASSTKTASNPVRGHETG